jgi:hypothetical protein
MLSAWSKVASLAATSMNRPGRFSGACAVFGAADRARQGLGAMTKCALPRREKMFQIMKSPVADRPFNFFQFRSNHFWGNSDVLPKPGR